MAKNLPTITPRSVNALLNCSGIFSDNRTGHSKKKEIRVQAENYRGGKNKEPLAKDLNRAATMSKVALIIIGLCSEMNVKILRPFDTRIISSLPFSQKGLLKV